MNPQRAAIGIEHWFRFFQVVGKSDLINEDTIKFPLIEYLIADGDDSLKNIKLEKEHPVFTSREVDLISIESTGNIKYCIEFKLASKLTMKVQERQRIFDDIGRLYFANHRKKCPTYLVVAGKTIDFLSEFRSVINKQPGKRGRPKKKGTSKNLSLLNPTGFYADKWLSFDMANPDKIIQISSETDPVYLKHYNNFQTDYLDPKESLPKSINTQLIYITEIRAKDTTGNVPAMVGIWQVSS